MFPMLPDDDRLLAILTALLARCPEEVTAVSLVDPGQGPLQWPQAHTRHHTQQLVRPGGAVSPEQATEAGRSARPLAPVSVQVERSGHAVLQAWDCLAVASPPPLPRRHSFAPVVDALPEGADLRLGADVALAAHACLAHAAILAAVPALVGFAEASRRDPIWIRRAGVVVAVQAVASLPLWTPARAWRLPQRRSARQ